MLVWASHLYWSVFTERELGDQLEYLRSGDLINAVFHDSRRRKVVTSGGTNESSVISVRLFMCVTASGMEPVDRRVEYLAQLIRQNCDSDWSLDHMATLVRLSPSRLRSLFARQIGVPPARFVKETRLERADELLRSTFLSVKEIALAVGFSDRSYFNQAYKKKFLLSPGSRRTVRHGSVKSRNE